jgi:hypothetical protein
VNFNARPVAQLISELVEPVFASGDKHQVCTALGEGSSKADSEPGTCTRHDNGLPSILFWHAVLHHVRAADSGFGGEHLGSDASSQTKRTKTATLTSCEECATSIHTRKLSWRFFSLAG